MQLRPNYVPKEKSKVNYKIVVPFVVVAAVLFYFALERILPDKVVDSGYTICNLSGRESAKMIEKREYNDRIVMRDYAQYGESLALFNEDYALGSRDAFSGKTIFLNNLCHGDERAYMMDVELDRKLPLEDLDDGFYELEILDGLDRFFLYSEELIDDSFYTINRRGYVKKVELLANKDMFKQDNQSIDNFNYVYLNVSTIETPEDTYDLVIDPAKLDEFWEGYVDYGYGVDGVTESDYTYNIAIKLQEKLEARNMKVKVLRDNQTPKNLGDEGGRLEEAYASGAKYYVSLAFPSSGSVNDFGSTIIYSSYASSSLASDISQSLTTNTELQSSVWSGDDDIAGVYPSGRVD